MVALKDLFKDEDNNQLPANGTGKYAGKYVFLDKKGNVEVYGDANDCILINENGKIKKTGKAEDINESDVRVKDYVVVEVNDEKVDVRDEIK